LRNENSTISAKNRPFPGDQENSPRKPPWQVDREPHNSNGQFLSSIDTDRLQSILTSRKIRLRNKNSTISAKNRPFHGDQENSPRKPLWQVEREPRNSNGQFLSSIDTYLLKSIITSRNTHLRNENSIISAKNRPFCGDQENSPLKPPWQVDREPRNSNGQFPSSIDTDCLQSIITSPNTRLMKENSNIRAKKGHFLETKKTHHGIHRDRSTGSLATATANFFHQSIQTAYKVY
jgi:hypothetical protein